MDLFDDEQVTTADQIKRPQQALEKEAIDDFMKRNPMAGGGMLVQPGFGGVRQGYAQPKLYEKYSQYFFNKPYSEIKKRKHKHPGFCWFSIRYSLSNC